VQREFDLVFVDPPFRLDRLPDLPAALSQSRAIRPGTVVVMEAPRGSSVTVPEPPFNVLRKTFGQTEVLIMQATSSSDSTHSKESLS
jgi:16S rRNA G966 N2-methylase RsmD